MEKYKSNRVMYFFHCFIICIFFFCNAVNGQRYKVEHAFYLQDKTAVIEGMAYDSVENNFYFGENAGLKILRFTKTGTAAGYIDAGKDGALSLLGMTVAAPARQLWVCGSILKEGKKTMCLFQYSLHSGKLTRCFTDISGKSGMFNDVAVTASGNVFTTDPVSRAVYKVDFKNSITALYMKSDSLKNANGITANGNDLFVSTSSGFARVNTADSILSVVRLENYLIAGNDGLYYYNHSLIGVQNVAFPVTIARYFLGDDDSRIKKAVILATEHSLFDVPTTGAVVGNEFYFMANTNLLYFDFEENKLIIPEKIKRIRVMKIPLAKN